MLLCLMRCLQQSWWRKFTCWQRTIISSFKVYSPACHLFQTSEPRVRWQHAPKLKVGEMGDMQMSLWKQQQPRRIDAGEQMLISEVNASVTRAVSAGARSWHKGIIWKRRRNRNFPREEAKEDAPIKKTTSFGLESLSWLEYAVNLLKYPQIILLRLISHIDYS